MIWLLPLQPLLAAEAEFAHLLENQSTQEKTVSHMNEHLNHVSHHHDDNGDSHEDESSKSMVHMVNFEHGLNFSVMLITTAVDLIVTQSAEVPIFLALEYHGPPAAPPLKPPYLAL